MENLSASKSDLGWLRCFWRLMLGTIFLAAGIWKCFVLGPMGHVERFFLNPTDPKWNFGNFFPDWLLIGLGAAIAVTELLAGLLLLMGIGTRFALKVIAALLVTVLVGHLLKEPLFSPLNHIFLRGLIATFVWVLPADADKLSLDNWWKKSRGQ